jgi:hypothetical protein
MPAYYVDSGYFLTQFSSIRLVRPTPGDRQSNLLWTNIQFSWFLCRFVATCVIKTKRQSPIPGYPEYANMRMIRFRVESLEIQRFAFFFPRTTYHSNVIFFCLENRYVKQRRQVHVNYYRKKNPFTQFRII